MTKIDWQEKGIYWKLSGIVTGDEIIEMDKAIYGDSRFDDIRYLIADESDCPGWIYLS